jgi:hypothetical protein
MSISEAVRRCCDAESARSAVAPTSFDSDRKLRRSSIYNTKLHSYLGSCVPYSAFSSSPFSSRIGSSVLLARFAFSTSSRVKLVSPPLKGVTMARAS